MATAIYGPHPALAALCAGPGQGRGGISSVRTGETGCKEKAPIEMGSGCASRGDVNLWQRAKRWVPTPCSRGTHPGSHLAAWLPVKASGMMWKPPQWDKKRGPISQGLRGQWAPQTRSRGQEELGNRATKTHSEAITVTYICRGQTWQRKPSTTLCCKRKFAG